MSRPRKLTASVLAYAYELRQEGVTLKAISLGISVGAKQLGEAIQKAERFGLSAALDYRRSSA